MDVTFKNPMREKITNNQTAIVYIANTFIRLPLLHKKLNVSTEESPLMIFTELDSVDTIISSIGSKQIKQSQNCCIIGEFSNGDELYLGFDPLFTDFYCHLPDNKMPELHEMVSRYFTIEHEAPTQSPCIYAENFKMTQDRSTVILSTIGSKCICQNDQCFFVDHAKGNNATIAIPIDSLQSLYDAILNINEKSAADGHPLLNIHKADTDDDNNKISCTNEKEVTMWPSNFYSVYTSDDIPNIRMEFTGNLMKLNETTSAYNTSEEEIKIRMFNEPKDAMTMLKWAFQTMSRYEKAYHCDLGISKMLNEWCRADYNAPVSAEKDYKYRLLDELDKQCWTDKAMNPDAFNEISERYKGKIDEKIRIDILADIQNVVKSFCVDLAIGKNCDRNFFEVVREKYLHD